MCGILGIVDYKGVDEALFIRMRDSMYHRGPDDSGIWFNRDRTVALGHRRLSIIDLSPAGHQPLSGPEGKIWITFNGEVYNFQEIGRELQSKGYQFRGHSDTEVIHHAYQEWGVECLHRFNGMFAFAIYDEDEKQIFIARDRAGKKPLYYTMYRNKFVFTSELKALILDRAFTKNIDLQALNHYLTYGYIGEDLCIYQGVKKLPPAHAMIYSLTTRQIKTWSYWAPPLPEISGATEAELLEELEYLLEDAVRLRMISDVPLGVFLSGGVDSSLIVAMMSRISERPVKTFSIGFEEGRYNELPYAKQVAEYFGTDHREIIVKPEAFDIFPEIVHQFDEPFADSSMIPTYYVSKATREFVTVALSGDGGDELFGGYSQYLGTIFNYHASKFLPSFMKKGLASAAAFLPDDFQSKRPLLRFKHDPLDAFIVCSTYLYFNKQSRKRLFSEESLAELSNNLLMPEMTRRALLEKRQGDFINRMTYTDFKSYLPDDILVKVDRASMMVSLEVRAPLLDYRIVEFAHRKIPGSSKVNGMKRKYLLKKLAEKILPPQLDINRKWGFSVPVSEWFRGALYPQIKEILITGTHAYFNEKYIGKLLEEHKSGIDHSARLFTLLTFLLWEKDYMNLS